MRTFDKSRAAGKGASAALLRAIVQVVSRIVLRNLDDGRVRLGAIVLLSALGLAFFCVVMRTAPLAAPPDVAPTWGQVLIAGGSTLPSTDLYNPAINSFAVAADTAAINTARSFAAATLLASGKVLIAGGCGAPFNSGCTLLSSTELYDPVTNSFAAAADTATMNSFRDAPTATLLDSGEVLIAGGCCDINGEAPSTELYDPVTNSFAAPEDTAMMNAGRSEATATLLSSGMVLIAGGFDNSGNSLASTELYDPVTNNFAAAVDTAVMNTARQGATATVLASGKVLIAGGSVLFGSSAALSSTELYDPVTNSFASAGNTASMNAGRVNAAATLLASGQVLIAGGSSDGASVLPSLASTELYDPATNTFAPVVATASMNAARYAPTATLLASGQVLVAGGYDGTAGSDLTSTELYDPVTNSFASPADTVDMNTARDSGVAVLLPATSPMPLYVGQIFNSTVGEYNAGSGIAINPNFITGLSYPYGLALSGNTLFVANYGGTTIGTYDATTGAPINSNFITDLSSPQALAVSGNTLYVVVTNAAGTGVSVGTYNAGTGVPINTNFIELSSNESFGLTVSGNNLYVTNDGNDVGGGTVGEYDATTGTAINANFITTGLSAPWGLVIFGNTLLVANEAAGTAGEYDAATGAAINANFIVGLQAPYGLALSGNDLFVANLNTGASTGTVGEYDATTGVAINANLITGLSGPVSLAVASPSEPSATATPTATSTPMPSPTATQPPTATATPNPTATTTATMVATTTQTPTQTATATATATVPATMTNLVITPETAAVGSLFTLTASVKDQNNTPVTNGSVTFYAGTTVLGTVQVVTTTSGGATIGTATLETILVPLGANSITAQYAGADMSSVSTPQIATVTGNYSTTTTFTAPSNGTPGHYTLTGTVTGAGPISPTGNVAFTDNTNAVILGSAMLDSHTFAQTFMSAPTLTGFSNPQVAALRDINGDGIPDLFIGDSNGLTVELGNGDGTFKASKLVHSGAVPESGLAFGDFNGDGKLDVAVATGGRIVILLGNGDGTFQTGASFDSGNPNTLAVGDFNGDGILDIIAMNSSTFDLLLGNGDGTFKTPVTHSVSSPLSLVVGDVNGDGNLDVLVATAPNNVSVFLANGNGTFQTPTSFVTQYEPGGMLLADLRGSGILDLVTLFNQCCEGSNTAVNVMLGNGNGTFQTAHTILSGTNYSGLAMGDFNGDGKLDLVVSDYGVADINLLLGNGDGSFQSSISFPAGVGPITPPVADLNHDGRPDIVVANYNDGTADVLLNRATQTATLNNAVVPGNGLQSVTASYAGDSNFNPSTSAPQTLAPGVTATATPNPTATPTATAIATPIATATPKPTPTIICPLISSADDSRGGSVLKAPKLPKFKPIKFPSQTLGTTSSPVTIDIPATAGLMISSVAAGSADFIPTTTCIGQTTPCSITIGYHPSRAGASRATLTIGNNFKKLTVALSGTGIGPKVQSVSPRSLPPLEPLTLNGLGIDPDPQSSVLVSFTEKIKKTKQPVVLLVPASNKTLDSVQVQVPPIFDPSTKELIAGTATLSLQELLKSGGTLSAKSPSLQIAPLNMTNMLPAGVGTLAFLDAESAFATQLEQDVMNTQLSALGSSLAQSVDALDSLIAILSNNPNADLGSIGGTQITESAQDLILADTEILQMLQTIAGGSTPSVSGVAPATGSGCLATEAAAALADMGNSTVFANDIVQLFEDSETSSACQQPGAASTALGIVNGAGGVALALTAQADNPAVQPVLPTAAVLLANLAPAGQLLSIGATLGQTTAQARQMVQSAVASFNQASRTQLSTVAGQSQGPLNSSYISTNQTETSFVAATPPPLDGVYAGSFTGTQFVSGTCSGALTGSLGFSVQGSTITVTVPGAGSGTLDPNTGMASFPTGGIGGQNVNCSFGGILLPNQSGPASASGTWSCISAGVGSSFNSANGTWMATAQ